MKMNFSKSWVLILIVTIIMNLFSGCGNKPTDTVIGNIDDGVTATIPNSISENLTFSIDKTSLAPSISLEESRVIGSYFDLNVEVADGIHRFDAPIILTFKIDDTNWEELSYNKDLKIAYYNGLNWDYLTPLSIDEIEHTITLETYHCSWLSPVEPTPEELIKQAALEEAIKSQNIIKNSQLRKTTESLVKSVMGEKVDKSLLQDVVEGMMNQNDFTQMLKAGANANEEEFIMQFTAVYTQVTANTLWAYAAAAGDNLGDLGSNLGLASSFGTSAALIGEGDYEAAAKELARGIIETQPLGKLVSSAVKITERQIARWKNEEIEAAYNIFINGKEPTIPYWGYGSIEAGNFEELWNQMRGINRQIIIDAVQDFEDLNGRQPTDAEKKQIEIDAKNILKTEFETRKNSEEAIEIANQKNLQLIEIMKDLNLLTKDRYGYDPDKMSFQQRLEQLLNVRNQIIGDTSRKISFTGLDDKEWIDAYTVTELISIYVRDGEKAYQEALAEKGYIEIFDLAKAAGTYEGSLVFSENPVIQSESSSESATVGEMTATATSNTSESIHLESSPITLELSREGTLSISYTVDVKGDSNTVLVKKYSNGESYTSTDTNTYSYTMDYLFKNIPVDTGIDAKNSLENIIGDRYASGHEVYTDPRGVREFDIERAMVSAHLKKLTTSISGKTLTITGQLDFNEPIAGMIYFDHEVPASFTIKITSN